MWAGDGEQQPAGLRPRVSGEGAGGGPSPGLGGARALCARLSGPLPHGRPRLLFRLVRVLREGREELTRKRPRFRLWGGNGVAVIPPHKAEVTAVTRPPKPATDTPGPCRLSEREG